MQQVLFNLIGNAIKYTPRGGKIRVSVQREGEIVAISVRDTGIGVAPEMLAHIFDLFVQSERTLDRSHGGLGIGLTMVRSLVEMHGGTVSAHSDGPGKGCEFVVRLPLIQTEQTAVTGAGASSPVQYAPSRRFLVVDDNVDLATSLAELLGLWGQETRVVHSGKEALEVLDEYRPDVMLLDIGLPDIDGYEVARRIKASGCTNGKGKKNGEHHTPLIVALTGYGQAKDRQRALDAGCDDHVSKPCDPERLRDLLVLETAC
jgi:two-component system CheB/CheR fusion protein